VDYIGWVDVLVPWISVLVFVLILLVAPIVLPYSFGSVALSGLLCVDAPKDTKFFHHVVRFEMKLAQPF
jgi:hypothetical protein